MASAEKSHQESFCCVLLLFNYDGAAGNRLANQRGVTRQLSVGWHKGLLGPSLGLLLYLIIQMWLYAAMKGMGIER